jgi:hypothetical protein
MAKIEVIKVHATMASGDLEPHWEAEVDYGELAAPVNIPLPARLLTTDDAETQRRQSVEAMENLAKALLRFAVAARMATARRCPHSGGGSRGLDFGAPNLLKRSARRRTCSTPFLRSISHHRSPRSSDARSPVKIATRINGRQRSGVASMMRLSSSFVGINILQNPLQGLRPNLQHVRGVIDIDSAVQRIDD